MQSVTRLISLVALMSLFSTLILAKVELKFKQDYYHSNVPLQLQIKTSNDYNISGMKFTPKLTNDEDILVPQPGQIVINTANRPADDQQPSIFGATLFPPNNGTHTILNCIDSNTKQLIGYLKVDEDNKSFTYIPNGKESWDTLYPKGSYPDMDMLCSVYLRTTTTGTISKRFQVEWMNDTTLVNDYFIDIDNVPTQRDPVVEIKDVSYTMDNNNKTHPIATISFNFVVDTVGIYRVHFTNALPIKFGSDLKDLFCKSGSNEKFARFYYNSSGQETIWVPTLPSGSDTIQCVFKYHNFVRIDDVNKVQLQLILNQNVVTTSKDIDYKVPTTTDQVSHFTTGVFKALKNEYGLSIDIVIPKYSKTPLKQDSTITMEFSSHIDLTKIDTNASSCGTRVITGQNATLTQFTQNEINYGGITCQLIMKGTNVFDYTQFKGATVSILMNEQGINFIDTTSNIGEFHVGANPIIKYDTSKMEDPNDDKNIIYVDRFIIENGSNWDVPAENVVLVFGLRLPSYVPLSYEDYSKQLQCQFDNDNNALQLNYDQPTMTWSTKINTLADGKLQYKLPLTCRRTVNKLTKYGRILNIADPMEISILIVPYGTTYINSPSIVPSEVIYPTQPKERPQGAKDSEQTKVQFLIVGVFTAPTNKPFTLDTLDDGLEAFHKSSIKILDMFKDEVTYKTRFKARKYISQHSPVGMGYVNFDAEQFVTTLAHDVFKSTSGDGLDMGIVRLTDDFNKYKPYQNVYTFGHQYEVEFIGGGDVRTLRYDFEKKYAAKAMEMYQQEVYSNDKLIPTGVDIDNSLYRSVYLLSSVRTVATECGGVASAQFYFSQPDIVPTFKQIADAPMSFTGCEIGSKCSVNLDCNTSVGPFTMPVCENKKCVLKPKVAPKWTPLRTENNTVGISIMVAMIVMVFVILF